MFQSIHRWEKSLTETGKREKNISFLHEDKTNVISKDREGKKLKSKIVASVLAASAEFVFHKKEDEFILTCHHFFWLTIKAKATHFEMPLPISAQI